MEKKLSKRGRSVLSGWIDEVAEVAKRWGIETQTRATGVFLRYPKN